MYILEGDIREDGEGIAGGIFLFIFDKIGDLVETKGCEEVSMSRSPNRDMLIKDVELMLSLRGKMISEMGCCCCNESCSKRALRLWLLLLS